MSLIKEIKQKIAENERQLGELNQMYYALLESAESGKEVQPRIDVMYERIGRLEREIERQKYLLWGAVNGMVEI